MAIFWSFLSKNISPPIVRREKEEEEEEEEKPHDLWEIKLFQEQKLIKKVRKHSLDTCIYMVFQI